MSAKELVFFFASDQLEVESSNVKLVVILGLRTEIELYCIEWFTEKEENKKKEKKIRFFNFLWGKMRLIYASFLVLVWTSWMSCWFRR